MAQILLNGITEENKELLIESYFKEQKREHHSYSAQFASVQNPVKGKCAWI